VPTITAIAPPADSRPHTPAAHDRILLDDLLRNAGNDGRLALSALLVDGIEPVPALGVIGLRVLLRIHHEAAHFLGQLVHLRAGGEVVGILVQPCSITSSGMAWPW
jgi:hypothetical protein